MAIHFAEGQEVLMQLPGGVYLGIVHPTEVEGEYRLTIPTEGNPVQRIDGKSKVKIVCE